LVARRKNYIVWDLEFFSKDCFFGGAIVEGEGRNTSVGNETAPVIILPMKPGTRMLEPSRATTWGS